MKTLVVVQPETDIEFEYMRSEFPILCHAPKYPLFAMTGKQRDDLTERIRRHERLTYQQAFTEGAQKYDVTLHAVTPGELAQLHLSVSEGIPIAFLPFEHMPQFALKNVCIRSVDTGIRSDDGHTAQVRIVFVQA